MTGVQTCALPIWRSNAAAPAPAPRAACPTSPSPSPATDIDGYALSNFRLGFRTEQGLDLFVWVRNAFDVKYFELLQIAPGSTGLIVGTPGDQRTWGGTLKIRF